MHHGAGRQDAHAGNQDSAEVLLRLFQGGAERRCVASTSHTSNTMGTKRQYRNRTVRPAFPFEVPNRVGSVASMVVAVAIRAELYADLKV